MGWTYARTAVILYAPTIENGGGLKNIENGCTDPKGPESTNYNVVKYMEKFY